MTRIPLGRAHVLAQQINRELRRRAGIDDLIAVGGVRRFAPDVGQVTLLAVASKSRQANLIKSLATLPSVTAVSAQDDNRVMLTTVRGDATVHFVSRDHAGSALVWHTGSRPHVDQLIRLAHARELRFDSGVLYRDGTPLAIPTEAAFYRTLGLPLIPPELRHGEDEIEAAAEGRLPDLISDGHIRGDLHMHTIWSDGRDSVEDMVGAARQLGYDYVAITDHSERALCARKLAHDDIARQKAEIQAVRERVRDIDVLHGVEVDIMHDGSLDFDDEALATFDIVLASLHDHGGQDAGRLTQRYLEAIRHPLVNIITHPANRSPGYSSGYAVDFDRLFEAAADTGTALEVDGAPGHLDLDGALARRAVAAGVTLTVDSDCHRAEWLRRQMRFGVGTARRGWVSPHHVLNTRPIADVREFIARKRARA